MDGFIERMKRKSHTQGFTLVELLVVIAIIALLATIAIVALGNARQASRDTRRVADIKQLQTALELYQNSQGGYPAGTATVLGSSGAACLNDTGLTTAGCTDPHQGTVSPNPTPGGADYVYNQIGGGSGYTITFSLEGNLAGLSAGAHTATQNGVQ